MDQIKNTHFAMNIVLHIIILFTFLSAFFFLYISKVEKQAFEQEIGSLIEDNLSKILTANPQLKPYIVEVTPALKSLAVLYKTSSRYTNERNIFVKFSAVLVVLILLSIFMSIYLTLKFSCGKDISIKGLIIENVIIFIFVGIIEYMFFTRIAIKYVPASPSLLVDTVVNTLKARV